VVDRLHAKWRSAADAVPAPVVTPARSKARYGIIAIGSSDGAVIEARDKLEADGMPFDYMRVRGFPFSKQVEDFINAHDEVFVVEQNRDAQLLGLIVNETDVAKEKLVPVLHYAGEPLNYKFVYDALQIAVKVRKIA
jgi:2-oxoglutarate ferredoxin oxidoreductase subunit alpha